MIYPIQLRIIASAREQQFIQPLLAYRMHRKLIESSLITPEQIESQGFARGTWTYLYIKPGMNYLSIATVKRLVLRTAQSVYHVKKDIFGGTQECVLADPPLYHSALCIGTSRAHYLHTLAGMLPTQLLRAWTPDYASDYDLLEFPQLELAHHLAYLDTLGSKSESRWAILPDFHVHTGEPTDINAVAWNSDHDLAPHTWSDFQNHIQAVPAPSRVLCNCVCAQIQSTTQDRAHQLRMATDQIYASDRHADVKTEQADEFTRTYKSVDTRFILLRAQYQILSGIHENPLLVKQP